MTERDARCAGGFGWYGALVRCGGRARLVLLLLLGLVGPAVAQPLTLVSVPFLSQSEDLCGGAAAAMVMRFWGAQSITAESFSPLVDHTAGGIATGALTQDLTSRGWLAQARRGEASDLARETSAGRPVIVLIEDRPGRYHYVVVVGWHARGVVLHDPARSPYRVMLTDEFEQRWRQTERWMLIVAPGVNRQPVLPSEPTSTRLTDSADESCEGLVASGVRDAQAGALDRAEIALTRALGCPGPDAIRELAGVRALQQRWPEVDRLAAEALTLAPSDVYAWQLQATARFMTDDPVGALDGWNHAGQPRLDLFHTTGLVRIPQRVAERLVGYAPGQVLTVERLRRVERQLGDWPALTSARVSYTPKPGGIADLDVHVTERDRVPRRPITLSMIGARAAVTRELRVALGPQTGEGDRAEFGWRFWHDRPKVSASFLVPAPWGGVWSAQIAAEKQPFTTPGLNREERLSAGITTSAWTRGWLRWQGGAGLERWINRGRFATLQGTVDLASLGEGGTVRVRGQSWLGSTRFALLDVSSRLTRQTRDARYALMLRAAGSWITTDSPLDLWPAGDTGHVRTTLLRAHPLVRDGEFRAPRLGTRVVTGSLEGQRWWKVRTARVAFAAFADMGRTGGRLSGGTVDDADIGLGVRGRFPGMPGSLRADAARGLRDGRMALSFVYDLGL